MQTEEGAGPTGDRQAALIDAMAGKTTEDIAARAEALKAKLTAQLAGHVASARAAERDKLEQELALALGLPVERVEEFGWTTLISMVLGVRAIADMVIGTALGAGGIARRQDLLVSFGVADDFARVKEIVERDGAQFRQLLGIDDRGRPLDVGDEAELRRAEAELNASLERPPGPSMDDEPIPPYTADGEAGTYTDRP